MRRLGPDKTADWARETIETYEAACSDPSRYSPHHKVGFRKEIRELKEFLEDVSEQSKQIAMERRYSAPGKLQQGTESPA